MSGDVARYYERLEPRERMIAAIEAAARTDDQEVDRLVGSCPRYKYVHTDLAFTQLMRAADFVTMALAVELAPLLRALVVLDSVCDYLEGRSRRHLDAVWWASDAAFRQGVRWGWARSGRDDDPPDPNELPDGPLPDVDTASTEEISAETLAALGHNAIDLARLGRSTLDGFEQWASEEGLKPLALIAAFAGYLSPHIKEVQPLLDAAEPDPEAVEQYADLCRALWTKHG
jgi:hypothetical protein